MNGMKNISTYTLSGILLSMLLYATPSKAQLYYDYIGAGHSAGIVVSASSSFQNSTPDKTIDGSGLNADLLEASRFLYQAGYGGKQHEIEQIAEMGFEAWIEDQFDKPVTILLDTLESVMNEIFEARIQAGLDNEYYYGPAAWHFNYAWWTAVMQSEDILRLKIAQALSEILVISNESDIGGWGEGASSYMDILIGNAFGNYEDILLEVALHPVMGYYLSHYNNPKEDLDNNIHPDENFAREIMQLFSIGLFELNQDGSEILDAQGNPIPTYGQNEIKELAKVFTGLGMGAILPNDWINQPQFGIGIWLADKTVPMAMYQNWHDEGEKHLLNGYVIPAGQSGIRDIQDAVKHLFEHQNVGPFLAKRLIQRLVKSNPSPDYIFRVAGAFNDNGSEVRGDMKAVIKAILLDEEARSPEAFLSSDNGLVKPPMNRYIQLAKCMELDNPYGRFWNNGIDILWETGHHILGSPTVFNFYSPDFSPNGPLLEQGLVAPELKIHNTASSVRYINQVWHRTIWRTMWWSWEGDEIDTPVDLNFDTLSAIAHDYEHLINELDLVLTHGNLSDENRQVIRDALEPLIWPWNEDWRGHRATLATYLIMILPDFVVFK
jgi:uncharacterized protein (DUF1800 family)